MEGKCLSQSLCSIMCMLQCALCSTHMYNTHTIPTFLHDPPRDACVLTLEWCTSVQHYAYTSVCLLLDTQSQNTTLPTQIPPRPSRGCVRSHLRVAHQRHLRRHVCDRVRGHGPLHGPSVRPGFAFAGAELGSL